VRGLFSKFNRALFIASVVAFFVNIFLFVFASVAMSGEAAFELSCLSIINMMLLSFVLLREPNQKS
jgi:hypothetical protein|tara:strand:- start:1221 stop:1418 length:198 start_codon:yes stop_codon:yes gene_type:complete